MALHPTLARMLEIYRAGGRPRYADCSPGEARALLSASAAALGEGPQIGPVSDLAVPTRSGAVSARLYRASAPERGLVVYVHGGGWVLGAPADFDALARSLVARSGCELLMVDYRLAPEHGFPAGLEDVEDAIRWASGQRRQLAGADVPLLVAGDSAGANLATVAVTALKDEIDVALQLLIYPVADCDFTTASYQLPEGDLFLSRADMQWFYRHYAPEALWSDPRISPLRATNLEGTAPAWIAVAEYDVLRDEAVAYAERLAAAEVPVELHRYAGMGHGFVRMMNLVETADRALDDAARAIREHCRSL